MQAAVHEGSEGVSSPYRAGASARPFSRSYRPELSWALLLLLLCTLLTVVLATSLERRLRRVDATCWYEHGSVRLSGADDGLRYEYRSPVCQVRTSGPFSTNTRTVGVAGAQGDGHWATPYPAMDLWSWRWRWRDELLALLSGFGLATANGCTEQRPFSPASAGTYFEVRRAAEAIREFPVGEDGTFRVSYGPWGATPLLVLAVASVALVWGLGIRRRGFRSVVTIDPVRRYVVIERATGPFRWARRVYRDDDVEEARTHEDPEGSFAALHLASGAAVRLYPWSTRDRRRHDRFVAEINRLLTPANRR